MGPSPVVSSLVAASSSDRSFLDVLSRVVPSLVVPGVVALSLVVPSGVPSLLILRARYLCGRDFRGRSFL
jgi:hypothetical protein